MDATSLLENLTSGVISHEQAVAESIRKIEAVNGRLNAAVEIMKDDADRQLQHLPDGPLKGLPISIKECYAQAGMKITSGSKRMKPIACTEDAAVVKKLKAAGAVVVARGNTSEFLLGRETDNLVYGTTNNCINPELTAGGSSGGDGSMVGSDCVAFGVGTDIGGSCRYPALFNGIVGFKPASGQIEKTGIFPAAGNAFSETMNSPGVLCRSVRDARLVYNVIGDKQLAVGDISSAQIFTSSAFSVEVKDDSIKQAVDDSVRYFKAAGFVPKDISIPESGPLYPLFTTLMFAGFSDKIYEWSVTAEGKKFSYFAELFRRISGRPTISKEVFALLPAFNLLKPSASKLEKTIATVKALREKYYAMLGTNGILVLPTAGVLAPAHGKFFPQYNKPGVIKIITPVSFCNILNLSCITLPAWKHQKNRETNPPGVQLVCAPGSEQLLLNVAEALEGHFRI